MTIGLAGQKNIAIIQYLLQCKQVDLTQLDADRDWNLLHYVAAFGNHEMIELVLNSKRFDVNVVNQVGETPIKLAVTNTEGDAYGKVKLFLNAGATVSSKEQEARLRELIGPYIANICNVSSPWQALKALQNITTDLLFDPAYAEQCHHEPKEMRTNCLVTNSIFQRDRIDAFGLREILQEDTRKIYMLDPITPQFENSGTYYPQLYTFNSFNTIQVRMKKACPNLQPRDIAIGTFKLILEKEQELHQQIRENNKRQSQLAEFDAQSHKKQRRHSLS